MLDGDLSQLWNSVQACRVAVNAQDARMNALPCLILLMLISLSAGQVPTGWPVLKTTEGKEYKDVKVTLVEPGGIKIMHAGGIARLAMMELPPEIRSLFQFNADAAKALAAKELDEKEAAQKAGTLKKAMQLTNDLVTVKEDKFTKNLEISFKEPVRVTGTIDVTAHYEGVAGEVDPLFTLLFQRVDREWRWMKHHPSYVLIDGQSWKAKERLRTDVFKGGRVYESIAIYFTPQQAAAFSQAKEVAIKIGLDELQLTPEMRLTLATVYTRWLTEMAIRKNP
jgi:hypothetical protein